jgi:hypothetical protein
MWIWANGQEDTIASQILYKFLSIKVFDRIDRVQGREIILIAAKIHITRGRNRDSQVAQLDQDH